MGVVQLDCPHCNIRNVAFSVVADQPYLVPKAGNVGGHFYDCFGICQACKGGVMLRMLLNSKSPNPVQTPKNYAGNPTAMGWTIDEYWPAPGKPDIPESLPDRISGVFLQAENSRLSGSYDAAGAMFRKAIDLATIALGADAHKKLVSRIDDLAAAHHITPALKQVAHKVRLDGNDAVHDEDPFTAADAENIAFFARVFLTYTFTLPAMLQPKLEEMLS